MVSIVLSLVESATYHIRRRAQAANPFFRLEHARLPVHSPSVVNIVCSNQVLSVVLAHSIYNAKHSTLLCILASSSRRVSSKRALLWPSEAISCTVSRVGHRQVAILSNNEETVTIFKYSNLSCLIDSLL